MGIANFLLKRKSLLPGSPEFGHALEHLVIQEIIAYIGYSESKHSLSYWRTTSGYEVDAVIGNARVAIEVKSTEEVQSYHTKGLKAFSDEFPDCLAQRGVPRVRAMVIIEFHCFSPRFQKRGLK